MNRSHIIAVNRPGDPGWIAPGSEQHTKMMSPSKVAAVLGFSRWQSPYGLWMEMAGRVEPNPPKDIFSWGHDCEPTAARRWLAANPGWKLSPDEVQFVIDPEHYGFPAVVTLDRRAVRGRSRRVVQFKIARDMDDLEKWGDDLTGECPEDYATQVAAEMLFTGMTALPGHLLVLGPFWTERIYPIQYDANVATWMIRELQQFYRSLRNSEPPELDDHVATYSTVRKLHPEIAAGTAVELDIDIAREFLAAHQAEVDAKKRLTGAKTRVLDAMGDTETARVGDLQIAKRSPHASGSVALNKARKTTLADLEFLTAERTSA